MSTHNQLKYDSQPKIAIAATFTSEPIDDSLSYWLEEIGIPYSIEFAPYNQVFQELLDPGSLLASNQNGINVILIRFEDWEGTKNRLQLIDPSQKEQILASQLRYTLPNQLEIAHLNSYETEYLYQEIFVDRVYLKHGIVFNEDDCIVDVGANIGLFTLFAQQKCPQGTIYAFEPAPHGFEKLQINANLYCQNAHVFNCGLGAQNKEETFTFYPRSSVFSSFAADTEQDEKAIRSVIINMLRRDNSLEEESLSALADEFLKDRLEQEIYQAKLRTLSEIIEEYKIEKIDLLKLDAEKSELAILQGIKDNHWQLIKQIVMEVHDQEGSTIKEVMGLLKEKDFEFVVDEETLLQGSGLFNIYATRPSQKDNSALPQMGGNYAQIEQNVQDFAKAVKTAVNRGTNPHFLCICPPSPVAAAEEAYSVLHEKMEELIETDLKGVSGVYLIKSRELTSTYPVEDYYDRYGDELGHIPYTPAAFGALGTVLARKISALSRPSYKVIVLDCDRTLWSGVCGEDGATGVRIDPPYLRLQEFIVAQQEAGQLICLCSKNQQEDVLAVFERHPDMLLKRHHLINWRINWQPKSENLKSLADELQLGLDSFILIDDNPVECAEVRANCPSVLTLQLPEDPEHIPRFLEHIWAFDRLKVTTEDKQRTHLYRQNAQRQGLQQDSLTFANFLEQLGLEIEISPMKSQQLSRVAQLTQRTNQFNMTTIRRSEIEIQQLCDSGRLECRVVKVKDRFGDYGLVGLILLKTQDDALFVDTFLLSCRVLGRGVEHRMLAYLGTIAQERGLSRVEVFYLPTKKNQPAWDFLESIGAEFQEEKDGGWLFQFPSQTLAALEFLSIAEGNSPQTRQVRQVKQSVSSAVQIPSGAELFERIANQLYSPELILKEIASRQQRQRPELEIEFVSPRTPVEVAIANLFAEVLKLEQVGLDDNFFELGGDSIRGAILINKLQAQLNEIIHFVVLFDTKTVSKLAAYVEENYPQATAKLLGKEITSIIDTPQERIDAAKVLQMRSLIPPLAPPKDDNAIKNPPAIFILSPYRSGSTLLRVILAGNPQLFAPPELELLSFNTLQERKAAFSGRYSFWLEGAIRTIMQIKGCNSAEAIALMEELEQKNLTTKQFYQLIQQWLGDKILVDKTPSYSIDLEVLKRAEKNFQNPLYIHLQRHPYATIRSYEEARVEQTFRYQHPFKRRELAELVWLCSHQNIWAFLAHVPKERQYQLKFEDLISQPQTCVEGICQFLQLEFHPDMLQPYKEKKQRMTDGIYAQSRMVGDVKFHEYKGIEAKTAESWKQYYTVDFLGDLTWQVAESLGYQKNIRAKALTTNVAIPRVSRSWEVGGFQTFPLSFAQARLWFLAQLEPENPSYNIFKAIRLQGHLDITVIESSFNEMIRRHEVLRTTFTMVEGKPVQAIASRATLHLSVLNLQGLSAEEQSAKVQEVALQEQLQPFDLSTELLLRATLVQLGSESHVLLLTMHHIISDGWSMGIFIKELSSLYQAFVSGTPCPLLELPIQYADFTIWQRQWLQGEVLQTQLDYWKQQLAGAPPLLELPTDRSRPPMSTFRGRSLAFQIDSKLTEKLKILSQKSGVTLFMTLLAAFTTLLFRYSNQEDILVGTPTANRNHQEIESLIGFFVNSLVMRTQLFGNPSFSELLKQVRQVAMDAYMHQDVPFQQVVEALQLERHLSYNPLFQVMFALQNAPMEQLELPGLGIASMQFENVTAKFDIYLEMREIETPQGTVLQSLWQYNSDLFDGERIARMAGHFQTLLAGIVVNPQQSVGTLPLLTEPERHQLLVEWNDTDTPYPDSKCIHQLFEEQVEQTPDAVALVYEDTYLTYQQLNESANQIAHYLQTLGVGPEVLVGIATWRSPEMIIGLLAILKAGGAYVPFDPDYPQERLAYLLEDSTVLVLLTQKELRETLPPNSAKVVYLDADQEIFSQYSQENLLPKTTPDSLAYIMYTSGSTGKPKGVNVIHHGVVRLVKETDYISLSTEEVILQMGSISFDVSTLEIWGSLLNGAKLVLMPTNKPSLEELGQAIRQYQVTTLLLSASLFCLIVDEGLFDLKPVHQLFIGGEALSVPHVQKILSELRQYKLTNVYGPTENTTVTCCFEIKEQNQIGTSVPIGRPIANTQIYILDRHLQPLPIGVWGELYIGGAGLARGYWNRPQLTAERFIGNPFKNSDSERLYKTGDLVRYLPDGNIEFFGRIDNQVKIRGFRIELSEIESVLTQHPQVRDAVAIAREDKPGVKRLAAYVIPEFKQPTSNELRLFVKEKLPDYMIPASFTVLEAFPITPNGKVDRHALPAPEFDLDDSTGLVSPRTHTEKVLARIWQDVLGLKQVGICDNFFELGGDSIVGIQIIARANQAGLKLTPKQLFQHQTIAELAAIAKTAILKEAQQDLVTGVVPLTPIQLLFFEQNLPEPHHFNQSVLLEVPPNLKSELLKQAVQKLLCHHDALRLRFVQQNGEWQQHNSSEYDIVPFQVIDLSEPKEVEQKAQELQKTLNLSEGPLMQVVLFKLGNSPGRLLIVIHHLAVDGVSWRILLEDLSQAYQQLNCGEVIKLPPKTTSFKDWAIRLQDYAQEQELRSELDYWLLSVRSNVNPLPVDYPTVADSNTVASRRTVSLSLSVEKTRALLQDVPSAYNTQINDVLLTALVQSFTRWMGSDSLLIDLEGHGREDLFEDVDLSRTAGWFTSIFPVLLKLERLDHPQEALKSVKEQLRRIPNRGIGYGILRYLSQDGLAKFNEVIACEKLQAIPQAEVSFNYLGQFDQSQIALLGWKYAQESSGPLHSPKGHRRHLLNVDGLVFEGRLKLEWKYSEHFHQRATVENLANDYMQALESIIAHCLSPEAGGYTPSDFPEVRLSQQELDLLLAEIE